MTIKAVLSTESKDAKCVASSLEADNMGLDGLRVETKAEGKKITTRIEARKMGTLINTLDDIISCQMAAEKTIG